MENRNYYTIVLSLLGAVKLVLSSFGINLITDQMANDLANAIATILTVGGVILTHIKDRPNFKALFAKIFKKKVSPAPSQQPAPVAEQPKPVETAAQPSSPAAPAEPTNTVQK